MPVITVRGPESPPVKYHFDQRAVSIGRSDANHLVLRDPSVSRLHVELRWREGSWFVADRGSRNGTRLNGSKLARPEPLSLGDEISLGDTLLVFDDGAENATHAPREGQPPTRSLAWSARGTGVGHEKPLVVGQSQAMRTLRATIEQVASSMATLLITGENGTGKELVARLVHHHSARAEGPYVVVNCPALPESLLESELFGVEKGVATGVEPRPGRFEAAQGGTLLLDEIGDMRLTAQAEMLRVLEEKTIERVGGRESIPLDIRILASTNHDLKADLADGSFRRDLYHRLNTVTLRVPPLRERRDDIPLLAEHFLARGQRPGLKLGGEATELLVRYDFPGNVRELERMMERAELLARGDAIEPRDLPEEVDGGDSGEQEVTRPLQVPDLLYRRIVEDGGSFWEVVRLPYLGREISHEAVRRLVERVYREAAGSYKRAAQLLGVGDEYKKFMSFLGYHGLRVKKSISE